MGIKRNFGYNLILTFCNYLFPLIVYPYVSRVLEVDNIGICEFIDSIINYFVIFSMAGISSFGVRETARYQNDKKKLNSIFSSLLCLNILLTIVAVIILVICIFTVPKFEEYQPYLWIGMIKLVFGVFIVEWCVQGLELFKYITIRTIIIRFLFVVSVFIFVHNKNDVIIYFGITACVTVVNAIVNWNYISQYVKFKSYLISLKGILKPVFSFGYYKILTSMYTSFNVVFLGFITTEIQVGYFSTATKLNNIIMSVFTAFTTVMIPRIADLLNKGNYRKLQEISEQVFHILLTVSIPLAFYCMIFANQIITIIAGPGYEGAIIPFKIIIGLIVIIGLEQILVQQFLMASPKSNRYVIYLSSTGAIVGLTLNLCLTPQLYSVGTSISWVCSEISVLIISSIYVKKIFDLKYNYRRFIKVLLWSTPYIVVFWIINNYITNIWCSIILGGLTGLIMFFIVNCIFQDPRKFPINISRISKIRKR